jgi:glycosyltransferase involved in cell wall biosynthesis
MRLLLVLTEFPPSIGGMQTHASYLSRHLRDTGHAVEVVTYRSENKEKKDLAWQIDSQLDFVVHRALSRLSYWHNINILREIAGKFKPDLIYCSTIFYGFLREYVSVPVVCRSVGNDVLRPWIAYPFQLGSRVLGTPGLDNWSYSMFKRMNHPEWLTALFEKKRRALVAESVGLIDIVIANSDFTAGLFDEMGVDKERLRVLVGGVDARRFTPNGANRGDIRRDLGIDDQAYVITTVCRLVAKKGIDFLLKQLPEARLLIVGDGKHKKHYRRLARELGLERVTFAGRIDHIRVRQYYWLSDLFVLASRVQVNPLTNQKDAETMGRVLCEANAAGVPVVAARSGGIPSVISHDRNGLLFDSDDEEDFLTQVIRVRNDPDLAHNLSVTGIQLARQKFDWSVILQAHEGYFGEVVAVSK